MLDLYVEDLMMSATKSLRKKYPGLSYEHMRTQAEYAEHREEPTSDPGWDLLSLLIRGSYVDGYAFREIKDGHGEKEYKRIKRDAIVGRL